MKKNICYIVGAGSVEGVTLRPGLGDYLIAADAGYARLHELGLEADMVMGDFDSLCAVPDHPNVVRHPAVKDDTDMMLAAKAGVERGYRTFVLCGGLGGRLDHSLANLQTLAWLSKRGLRAFLVGEGTVAAAVTGGALSFGGGKSGIISVFCCGDRAGGVTLAGLKYPLSGAVLTCDMPLGVSNEFTGVPASVSVREGTLLVLWGYTPGQTFGEIL